ncbi:glycosyltransferase family 4 protein [Pelagibacteraceae bacterium]|nr:glycosyltransferase family 4 protein [Pelagibacteraceae bacterium]
MSFKVLQVIPKLGFGGAETGCYDLAHFLAEQGCTSIIVTSGGPLLKYIKKEKVKIIKLPVHSKNFLIMIFNSIIISIIAIVYNINIVHARSRAPAWSCYVSCLVTRRKFITTFHGTYSFEGSLKKFYNSIMIRSNLIIAGSNFIFNHINENYKKYLNNKNKLMVIFRGVNLDYFNPKNISEKKKKIVQLEWKIDEEKHKILLPGRLTGWKGQEYFIEALNILVEDYNNINFQAIILGSDQGRTVYTKKLYSLVERYNLNKKIKFVEHCKDMPIAYSIADIIISSSIKPEAFGRVSVEAQAMKKPIIASNIGGSRETILNGKSGFLYKYDDPRELAKTISTVLQLDKDALNLIGNEGRKNVTKKFDVEKMCQTTFTEYKKILNI